MYNEDTDQPCIPKTWNISDDLGQIEYIFSDKTGTLTQNVMEFRRCTINGVAYGMGTTEAEQGAKKREKGEVNGAPAIDDDKKISDDEDEEDGEDDTDLETAEKLMYKKQADLFDNKYIGPNPTFVDPKLFDDLGANNQQSMSIVHFFSSLALCHTVIVERPDEENENIIEYKAQSPDEAALVATARDLGFSYVGREKDTMILDVMGERKKFELLNVLEFNSTRKRMSVIVRAHDSDRIILLCKGADSIIYEHLESEFKDQPELEKSQKALQESTTRDLEDFANQGKQPDGVKRRIMLSLIANTICFFFQVFVPFVWLSDSLPTMSTQRGNSNMKKLQIASVIVTKNLKKFVKRSNILSFFLVVPPLKTDYKTVYQIPLPNYPKLELKFGFLLVTRPKLPSTLALPVICCRMI